MATSRAVSLAAEIYGRSIPDRLEDLLRLGAGGDTEGDVTHADGRDDAGVVDVEAAVSRVLSRFWVNGLQGLMLDFALGAIDAQVITARELRIETLIAEVKQALAGERVLAKSYGVLAEAFTLPALGATGPIRFRDFEHLPGFQVAADGDTVQLPIVDNSHNGGEGILVAEMWGRVTDYVDLGDGTQSWTWETLDVGLAGAGYVVPAEFVAFDWGTPGQGLIDETVIDPVAAPKRRVFRWYSDAGTGLPDRIEVVEQQGSLADLDPVGLDLDAYGTFTRAVYGYQDADNLFAVDSQGVTLRSVGGDFDVQVGDGRIHVVGGNLSFRVGGGDLTGILDDIDGSLDALTDDLAGLAVRVSDNEAQLLALAGLVTDNASAIAALVLRVTETEGGLEALALLLAELDTDLDGLADALAALVLRVTDNEGGISAQAGLLVTLGSSVSNLETLIDNILYDVDAIEDDVAGIVARVDEMGARLVLVAATDGSVAAIVLDSGEAGSAIRFTAHQFDFTGDSLFRGSLEVTGALIAGDLEIGSDGTLTFREGSRTLAITSSTSSSAPRPMIRVSGQTTAYSGGSGAVQQTSIWTGQTPGTRLITVTVTVNVANSGTARLTFGGGSNDYTSSGTYTRVRSVSGDASVTVRAEGVEVGGVFPNGTAEIAIVSVKEAAPASSTFAISPYGWRATDVFGLPFEGDVDLGRLRARDHLYNSTYDGPGNNDAGGVCVQRYQRNGGTRRLQLECHDDGTPTGSPDANLYFYLTGPNAGQVLTS